MAGKMPDAGGFGNPSRMDLRQRLKFDAMSWVGGTGVAPASIRRRAGWRSQAGNTVGVIEPKLQSTRRAGFGQDARNDRLEAGATRISSGTGVSPVMFVVRCFQLTTSSKG